MHAMTDHRFLPDTSRLSILTGSVLLAFALTRVLNLPQAKISLPLPMFVMVFSIDLRTIIAVLAALLTAVGVDWLLRTHPSLEKGKSREHWLLPMLTVLVLGIALNTLPQTGIWWLGFTLVAVLLVLVLLAEYVAVDPSDARYPLATVVLTALAFAIFLILAAALRAANARLFLLAPALFFGAGLPALRTLHLRLTERWEPAWALGIGLAAVQLGAALHYWPLSPLDFGLALLAPVYALTVLSVSLADGVPFSRAAAEPAVMLVILWGLLIWFH
jgi:hypothetical protein